MPLNHPFYAGRIMPPGLLKHSCQFGVSLVTKLDQSNGKKPSCQQPDLPGCFLAWIPCYSLNSRFPLLLGYTTLTYINHYEPSLFNGRFQIPDGLWVDTMPQPAKRSKNCGWRTRTCRVFETGCAASANTFHWKVVLLSWLKKPKYPLYCQHFFYFPQFQWD